MGFFNSTASIGGNANIEDLLKEDLNIYEGMSIMEANYAAIAETEMNWNAIMEAAAATEMSYFAENGEEYVYTEASGFFGKISEFFKKIWEKIKSIFKKFMVMIGSLWTKDKEFVKKYGETIRRNMKNIPSDYEMKGYVFTFSDTKSALKEGADGAAVLLESVNKLNAVTKDTDFKVNILGMALDFTGDDDKYDATELAERIRGAMAKEAGSSDSGNMTQSEFSKAVTEALRNNESSPVDIKLNSTTVSQALSDLSEAKQARRDAENVYKQGEKDWKKVIQQAEKLETSGYKSKPENSADAAALTNNLKNLNRAIAMARSISNDYTTMNSLYLTAVKDKYNQDKRMCVKVVTFREAKSEGAYVEHFTEGSAFAGLNLI